MLINTGQRTDIPAFYGEWFYNRVRAGFVLVRNPYFPEQVTRYLLSPEAVDALIFCTKNPAPMLGRLRELDAYRQFWHVTITPYGREIEPQVPDKEEVLRSFRALSERVGKRRIGWRYDPVFLSGRYPAAFHEEAFARMAKALAGYTEQAVVSFIDLYQKTKRNFPEAKEVAEEEQMRLARSFAAIGKRCGMRVYACFEREKLADCGLDVSGCCTKAVLERAFGEEIEVPGSFAGARPGCACLISADIGAYNTCGHLCRYCYANEDAALVRENRARHDPASPFLIGGSQPGDIVRQAKQERWMNGQMRLLL